MSNLFFHPAKIYNLPDSPLEDDPFPHRKIDDARNAYRSEVTRHDIPPEEEFKQKKKAHLDQEHKAG